MTMTNNNSPIGVFDSGLGGLSVLRKCMQIMPGESFIYYGDSLHAPYGTKTLSEVQERSFDITELLMGQGIKALVVACNTATSAAVKLMRERYKELPLVGIEPAIKPAAVRHPGKTVLVMATPMTLSEVKFKRLKSRYEDTARIIDVPCPGLMEYIEKGILSGGELDDYLKGKLCDYDMTDVGAIVLGCTHYPFIYDELKSIVGDKIEIIDGSEGTAREIKRRIELAGISCEGTGQGELLLMNSATDEIVNAVHSSDRIVIRNQPENPYLQRSVTLLSLPW